MSVAVLEKLISGWNLICSKAQKLTIHTFFYQHFRQHTAMDDVRKTSEIEANQVNVW